MIVHRAGTVSRRFPQHTCGGDKYCGQVPADLGYRCDAQAWPQDCPDNKPGFCFACHENACHDCGGYRWIETGQETRICPGCGGDGTLESQQLAISDPESAMAIDRERKGWQP